MRYMRHIVGILSFGCVSCVVQEQRCSTCATIRDRNSCYPISSNLLEDFDFYFKVVEMSAREKYAVDALTEKQQQQLARCIVSSAVWKQVFVKYHRDKAAHKPDTLDLYLDAPESVFHRIILPHLRKELAGISWSEPLLHEDAHELLKLNSSFFTFVADHYVKLHPEDANGWYFLWLFMSQPNDSFETPYCKTIVDWLVEENMNRHPYGKRILSRVREERHLDIPRIYGSAVLQPDTRAPRMTNHYCYRPPTETPIRQKTTPPRRNAGYQNARKLLDALPEAQKAELAAAIVHAADWTALCRAPSRTSIIIDAPNSIFRRHALPALQQRIDATSAAHALLQPKRGQITPIEALGADIFLLVGEHYIKQHPGDRNAWNFLLLHAKVMVLHDEYYADVIGRWILANNMIESPYVLRFMNLLREYRYVDVDDFNKLID